MARHVSAYLSPQSPYSYFACPRLRQLDRHPEVEVRLRPVRPGVLRIPETYAHRGRMEQDYFRLDSARTAAFLGLAFAEPDPDPVAFVPGSYWRAEREQPRVYWLLDLIMAAAETPHGLAAFEALMRLIWDGGTRHWHRGNHVRQAIERAGPSWGEVNRRVARDGARLRKALLANEEALLASGHWGVPCFVLDGEPFFGQDRFDQLLWRLGMTADPAAG